MTDAQLERYEKLKRLQKIHRIMLLIFLLQGFFVGVIWVERFHLTWRCAAADVGGVAMIVLQWMYVPEQVRFTKELTSKEK